MKRIERYFASKQEDKAYHVLDDKTCIDLDFDAFFKTIDYTISPIGKQYLYYSLRVFQKDRDKVLLREKIVQYYYKHKASYAKSIRSLSSFSDNAYFISVLFQKKHVKSPRALGLMKLIPFVMVMLIIMMLIHPIFSLLFFPLFLLNGVLHYWYKRVLMNYSGAISALVQMLSVAEEFVKDESICAIDTRVPAAIKNLKKMRYEMALFNVDNRLQGDMYMLVWAIYEFIKIVFLLEPLSLFNVLRRLEHQGHDIDVIYCFVGEVDVIQSLITMRREMKTCIPKVNAELQGISCDGIYHPLIENCVKNSIDVSMCSVLLTGSNMSGKTSFIKSIAINVIMGLALNTCFADSFSMPYYKLYTAIRITDDLLNDKSYYKEEVLRIGEMIHLSQQESPCLFILDEIYKGTNTQERIAAGKAVLSYLLKSNNTVFVSTHDIELAELLEREYKQYHFTETVSDKEIAFDYKIKEGKLTNRNAIRILALNHYPQDIIEEAIQISNTTSA